MFTIFTVTYAVSFSMGLLVAFRFFSGCFGAAPVAIEGTVVGDWST